jgi:hypothetical protein
VPRRSPPCQAASAFGRRPTDVPRRAHRSLRRDLHHPCPGKAEVVLAGTAHDDVVQDTDADVLQGLGDLVGGVDVFFGRIALLSGVRSVRRRSLRWPPDQELVRRHPGAEQVAIMSKTGGKWIRSAVFSGAVLRRDPLCRTRFVNLAVEELAAFGNRIPKAPEPTTNVYGLVYP